MTVEKYHEICSYLRDVTMASQWEGHVYAVGGCCRDELMGQPIKDIDLAIDLPGGGISFAEWLFKKGLLEAKPVTFPMFGTARFTLAKYSDEELEVVQTRSEKYTDRNHRNPETAFGSIEEDAIRRDLTINAIYRNLLTGEMWDVNGKGCEDIAKHIIRTPADPDMTYDDDPVRILRCIRFAARLGWEIEDATYQAIVRNITRLSIVSTARMRGELEKILTGPNVERALELLLDTGAMKFVIPELGSLSEVPDKRREGSSVWQHTLEVIKATEPDIVLRLGALFIDLGYEKLPEWDKNYTTDLTALKNASATARNILKRLRFPKELIKEVSFLVSRSSAFRHAGNDLSGLSDEQLRRVQLRCRSVERWNRLLTLAEAYNSASTNKSELKNQVEIVRQRTAEMEANGTSMLTFKLPVSVREVCRMKRLRRGPELKECMDYLWNLACANPERPDDEFRRLLKAFRPSAKKNKPVLAKPVSKKRKRHRESGRKRDYRRNKQ